MSQHKEHSMRIRYSCDMCNFKTTSDTALKLHISVNHAQIKKTITKRKSCEICNKKFNKDNTYNQHMNNVHKGNMSITKEGGRSKNNK